MSLEEFLTHTTTPEGSAKKEDAYYAFYFECLNKARDGVDQNETRDSIHTIPAA